MLLTCRNCSHVWEDDPEEEVADVWCNRCGQKTPVHLATRPPQQASRAHDPSDAPTLAPTSTPPPRRGATPTPADPISLPTIQVGSFAAHDDSEAPTLAPTPLPPVRSAQEAPTMPGTTPPPRPVSATSPTQQRTVGRPPSSPPPARPPSAPPRTAAPSSRSQVQQARTEALRVDTEPQDPLIGKQLDGYRIEGKLGEGGMGAVYKAHQVSLDRKVALKVLPARYARSPEMVARFTREALSAAQLTHHNIIQVYDVGNERGLNYITMELVDGESLGDAMRRDGRLQVDDAAGYVLQAARGLQYAHERGIIHRDIKPANLMINRQGIVKIADMGLAKRVTDKDIPASSTVTQSSLTGTGAQLKGGAAAELTQASVAMGTPAYMAPEQGEDAGSVDGRADQYSLGITLYYLCTGRTPYDGTTAQEIISKHKSEPLPPIGQYLQNVPRAFEGLISRMLAKSADQRFPSLKEVIHELELFLGIDSEKGPYSPREQHLAILEAQCAAFYAAPTLARRRLATRAFLVALPVLFALGVVLAISGDGIGFAGGVLGLGLMTALANFVIEGVRTKGFLFRRLRSVIFGMTPKGWALTGVGALVGLAAFWFLGWIFYWAFFAVIGVGLAVAYQKFVAGALRAERAESVEITREMLKELRLKGVSEEAVQQFVCRFAGDDWEEFFEQLFGYEAMIEARSRWAAADRAHPRRKFATWREPLVRWIERIENSRREAREKKELERVEMERLKAEGVNEAEAQKQAVVEANKFQQEQLHKIAAKDVDWTRFQSGASRRKVSLNFIPSLVRASIALAIATASFILTPFGAAIPLPDFFLDLLTNHYYPLGLGNSYWAIVAGGAAFLAAFSRRALAPWCSLAGALLIVGLYPFLNLVNQPQFTEQVGLIAGLGLAVGGFAYCLMGTLSGDKY